MKNNNNKNLPGGSPKQVPSLGVFEFRLKKMITEVLLALPLYLILFFIWWGFQPLIKALTYVGDTFYDHFFDDVADTPKESIAQHRKREQLKSVLGKRQGNLLGKLTHERVDKASDETINKKYAEHNPRELNEEYEKTGKALGKHVINLHSTGIS